MLDTEELVTVRITWAQQRNSRKRWKGCYRRNWHQLRQAVLFRRLVKRCAREACGKIFEVRKRADQIYCNDTYSDGSSRCKSLATSEKNYIKYKKRGAQTITGETS